MHWFQQESSQVLKKLTSSLQSGLSNEEAQSRLATQGENRLHDDQQTSIRVLLLNQLKNPLIWVLAVGVVLSLYSGHYNDAIAISIIILINTGISFFQEYKAQKSIDALRKMSSPQALVLRDQQWSYIAAAELVPGDIVKLTHGSLVPADLRLLESHQLQIDEAPLTGESEPAYKHTDPLNNPNLTLGDQNNMAFMGTHIVNGHGIGVVCETGMQTQVGQIAHLMQTTEVLLTPLQQRIHKLSKVLIGAAISVVILVVVIGVIEGMRLTDMVSTGISLAVAAIPEGMLTILTIVLTLGAKQMYQNKGLVRQLASVETLGSTSVICSDKTGTLTQNLMQVTRFWLNDQVYQVEGEGYSNRGNIYDSEDNIPLASQDLHLEHLLTISALCNDAHLIHHPDHTELQGTPTEGALLAFAGKSDIHFPNPDLKIVKRFPFDSKRKMMSVIAKDKKGDYWLFCKGAPDVFLKQADHLQLKNERAPLPQATDKVEGAISLFADDALRTLAIGYRKLKFSEIDLQNDVLEKNLIFLGLLGIMDPPRPEAIKAINECHKAGIKVKMITGDHANTAQAIARQMGIVESKDPDAVLTGQQLSMMNDETLKSKVTSVHVFARVTPEHKLRIVKALQANHEVVAMTGDGVNDAPALRAADMGVAMGITGTEVAKESADLILLDDNFATIVHSVREGRRIYDNIRKFIRQDLTTNVSEVSAILFAFLVMAEEPLLTLAPMMILWINLVSDGLPSLALGFDGEEKDVMQRLPRDRNEHFFSDSLGQKILIRGLVMGAVTYFMFWFGLQEGDSQAYAQTLAFSTLVFGQLVLVFDSRTFSSLYRRAPFGNPWLIGAVTLAGSASMLMVFTTFGNAAFGTVPLSYEHLAMAAAIGALPTFILSAFKEIFKIKWL
ncbi:cation-translocating P-type ATPase [Thiomicrorhabdus heinhorstiae]|uniref:Cation-transporting P-type ATPase n=1 Tax=Thiomicrorhabdus heinhorstiae TaxID=2748010 RepID=A0ABS0BYN4_9GAMM|nr:cation-transporting P-type ATPase [Thiomicrorhabdus heinhorstiae]MBF6058905.1 cation-transporting P-type ATPase [Thiomicrorhabdus heinhorstiae]